MTIKEFQEKFDKSNKFVKYWNYSICVVVIIGAPFFLVSIMTLDTLDEMPIGIKFFLFGFTAFFMSLGIYGFWRIPLIYKLTEIETKKSTPENIKLIEEIKEKLDLILIDRDSNYFIFDFKGKFWNRIPVYIFVDQNRIYLNVQSRDYGIDKSGFIDFGVSKRVRRKIENEIKASYQQGV